MGLPFDRLTTLLESTDMRVLASALPGKDQEQWINRVVVESVAGEPVIQVAMRGDLYGLNRTSAMPGAFETLEVKMDWWNGGVPLMSMPPPDAYFLHWRDIHISFARVRQREPLGHAPQREAVMLNSNTVKLLIISSSAKEF